MSATDQRPEVSGANARRDRMGGLSRTPVALPSADDAPASPHTTPHAQPGEPVRSSYGYHKSDPDHQHADIRWTIDNAVAIPRAERVPSGLRRFTDRDRPFPMTFAKITWIGHGHGRKISAAGGHRFYVDLNPMLGACSSISIHCCRNCRHPPEDTQNVCFFYPIRVILLTISG